MKILKTFLFSSVLVVGAVITTPLVAQAQSPGSQMQQGLDSIGANQSASFDSTVTTAINLFLYVIGALAVIMIIYGGFKYVTSAGEASAVSSAKNTIMYAIIGLIVAILAWAIASFVVGVFDGNSANDAGSGAANGAINSANNSLNSSNPINTTNGASR